MKQLKSRSFEAHVRHFVGEKVFRELPAAEKKTIRELSKLQEKVYDRYQEGEIKEQNSKT